MSCPVYGNNLGIGIKQNCYKVYIFALDELHIRHKFSFNHLIFTRLERKVGRYLGYV